MSSWLLLACLLGGGAALRAPLHRSAFAARALSRSPVANAHGGGHSHRTHVEPASVDVETGSLIERLQVQLVRPLLMRGMLYWGAFRRHTLSRSAFKQASYTEGASRITWVGAFVNLLLSLFKVRSVLDPRTSGLRLNGASP